MTAIAGFWRLEGGDPGPACATMLTAQTRYGPHASSQRTAGPVAMGRNLYRILPEDRHDSQPMVGGNGRFLMVADARLDNRAELAAALGLSPVRFAEMADAHVLLAAWERWEERAFERVLGDYALAVWDAVRGRLVLARDPMGVRPLHYYRHSRFLAFASMPAGLHCVPGVPHEPDLDSVSRLLALANPSPGSSFFAHLRTVEPGHLVEITASGERSRAHWQPQRDLLHLPRAADYADALREQLDRAVAARLRGAGGVPGAHLSGGRDSGAVAATAARLLAPAGGSVVGFTAVPREGYPYPDPAGRIGDEGATAATTAALYPNLEQVLVRSKPGSLLALFERAYTLYQRPLFNPCNQRWFDAINDSASERGLSVLLTGQMGNMTISYTGEEWLGELADARRHTRLLKELVSLVSTRRIGVQAAAAEWLRSWRPARREGAKGGASSRAPRHTALSGARWQDLAERGVLGTGSDSPTGRSAWDRRLAVLRRIDTANYTKGVLAGWGVDMRDATCDRRLIEFCLAVPPEQFLRGGRTAALAYQAFSDRLPHAVLDGRTRGLQAIDWHEPLEAARDELLSELQRLEADPGAREVLDLKRMGDLLEAWPTGDWNGSATVESYRMALLRGFASGHFVRRAGEASDGLPLTGAAA